MENFIIISYLRSDFQSLDLQQNTDMIYKILSYGTPFVTTHLGYVSKVYKYLV